MPRLRSKVVWTTENAKHCQTEGLDPDDPAVVAAIDPVWWELSLALRGPWALRPAVIDALCGTSAVRGKVQIGDCCAGRISISHHSSCSSEAVSRHHIRTTTPLQLSRLGPLP